LIQDSSGLPEIVRAMLEPGFYPEKPETVELLQTQMSFVFLAGEFVYKVKKTVNLGYLDYTTLEKRRDLCEHEVELNRRLCPDTYLGVLPVVKDGNTIRLGGSGNTIEYAVKMRYLPQERMMNVLLPRNEVSSEMMERVAQRLAEFHRKAETNTAISVFGSLDSIKTNVDENFNQTEKSVGRTISPAGYSRIMAYAQSFMKNNTALFQQRIAEGRIRDCHGDLHAAHICFIDGLCIYDCIEFNDRFRYCDVASEIAFLAMDLDHYGRSDLSRVFTESYVNYTGDNGLFPLLAFYKCYRAYVRGKVESFKLDDPYIPEDEKARVINVAGRYFELAGSYI
jgi:aminoglycoside phosphotransferase family enzyme